MKVIKLAIDKITPYERNTKIHTKEQIEQIKKSIANFGFNDPIAVWGDKNIVVEGHGRLIACKELGYTEVECIRLDHLTDEERRAYAIAHNSINLFTGFDEEALLKELEGISFDMSVFGLDVPEPENEVKEDNFDIDANFENINLPRVRRGEIWKLGKHRLLCGDCTDVESVSNLLAGNKISLYITDPPYNVDYTGKTKDELKIENDCPKEEDFIAFLTLAFSSAEKVMLPGAAFYIFYASRSHIAFETALKNCGLSVRQQLIWNKNSFVLGRQDYQWKHESILYGWKEGASHYFIDSRSETTVIDCEKPSRSESHPTMKPVSLISKLISNSSKKGQLVFDGFGGSGSTLIACEQLERPCCIMELDEKYATVIVERWEQFTGREAIRECKCQDR